jgi:hypothetical protein
MQTVLLSLIIIAVVAAAVYGATRKTKNLDTFRAEAADQFNVWLASGSATQLGLRPGNCEIVKRSETVGDDDTVVRSYTLTLFLRNGTGQYVMFKSTSTGPYVKLVEQSIAKVVLKDKFVPY